MKFYVVLDTWYMAGRKGPCGEKIIRGVYTNEIEASYQMQAFVDFCKEDSPDEMHNCIIYETEDYKWSYD